jgi:ComF family protein
VRPWSARSARRALEHLLLPGECLLCRRLLSFRLADRLVCELCRHRWRALAPPACARCGQPGPHFGRCRICASWPAVLASGWSAVWLEEGARRAVHALKYQGWPRLASELAGAIAAHLPRPAGDVLLVPVPLAAGRQRRRGYNQSERLAAALGARWQVPVRTDLLRRVRETATQTALTPEARAANVAGAFLAPVRARPGVTLVLVDDVLTTGATLGACAHALAGAGWDRLAAVTFGRAVIPDFT